MSDDNEAPVKSKWHSGEPRARRVLPVRTCVLCNHSGPPQAFVLKPDDHEKRVCRYQQNCARRQLERDAEQKAAIL